MTETSQAPDAALPVVFALHDPDGAFWLNTAVAVASAAEHATRPISIHVLHDETLTPAARERLTALTGELRVPLTLRPVELPVRFNPNVLRQFTVASTYRLLIPDLFRDHPLVVYLDSDLVVNGVDVTELAVVTPADAPLAGASDSYLATFLSRVDELDRLGLEVSRYVNSGVLAMRPGLIGPDLLGRFIAFMREHPRVSHPDQDFLNHQFKDRLHLLDERFNTMVGSHKETLLQPLHHYWGRIVHYVGRMKPTQGFIAPAYVPFWIHAGRIPEIARGALYSPDKYLFPVIGMDDGVRAVHVGYRLAGAKETQRT